MTISALDAPSSESGILKHDRGVPEVFLSPGYTLRRKLRPFDKVLAECPLNSRGWCLQERLLSAAVLHFGAEQMFWECRQQVSPESAPAPTGQRFVSDAYQMPLLGLNAYIETARPDLVWNLWYRAVEEFSRRNLTF